MSGTFSKIPVPLHHSQMLYRCPTSPNATLRTRGAVQRALTTLPTASHHRCPPAFRQPQPPLADGRQPSQSPPERPGAAQPVPAAAQQGSEGTGPAHRPSAAALRRAASDVTRGLTARPAEVPAALPEKKKTLPALRP